MDVAQQPSYCFSPASFSSPLFEVDAFIAAQRSVVSLERLHSDLQVYQRHLKNELVELINRDYADFINLSTNLAGMDKALEHIRVPVLQIRDDVVKTRSSLQEIIEALERKLEERTVIREKKAILQLLLNISDSVRKAEELLNVGEGPRSSPLSDDGGESGHLTERVASVFNQLQFYVSQAKGLPFLNNIQPRIIRITDMLKQSLEAAFSDGIRQNDTERLTQCLRTYALIDRTKEAELLYKRVVVTPFVQKVVTNENLETLAVGGRSRPDALAALYQDVINFVRVDRSSVLAITKSVLRGTGYDLYSNAIWPEVVTAITKNLPGIFNAGIPDVFYKHYTYTMNFVSDFESQLPSLQALQTLRSHQTYVDFMQRWQQRQLPIYYQIRFKELSSQVEEVLQRPESWQRSSDSKSINKGEFLMPATIIIYSSLERCWSKDVFLYGLSHRFWKLTMQLLARYSSWIETVIPEQSESNSNESKAVRPAVSLDVLVWSYLDIQLIMTKTQHLYEHTIEPLLPPALTKTTLLKESLQSCSQRLSGRLPSISNLLVQMLLNKSYDLLLGIRSIPGMYRMTNREAPSRASTFVADLMTPLHAFIASYKAILPTTLMNTWVNESIQNLTQRYFSLTSELLQTVKKTEDTLLRLKQTRRKAATSGSDTAGVEGAGLSDEDKIRLQLLIDVEHYTDEIRRFDVDPTSFSSYNELYKLVEVAIRIRSGGSLHASTVAVDTLS